ncbi:MAG: HD domain-containing protein [Spirochaetia bacterium]|jgi:HD-GYP domain-containing protein (c-di-GMP phosphodiesterase class II)|nr:HD domain-containing protein [Spirochaetia bacterium]
MGKAKIKQSGADELLKTIFQYVVKIANERDVDKLLVNLADMGRDLVSADRCTVWLIDRKAEIIWSKVAHGMDRIEIPMTKGIAGYVAKTGEHLVINDAYNDDRFDKQVDIATGYHTRNILALPVQNSQGETIGVYQAINKVAGNKRFTKKDLEHLLLAASYTGNQLDALALQEEIELTQREIILTLAETGEMRSKETGNHVKRVAEYSAILAKEYGLEPEEIRLLKDASPMHDIGKIAIPDSILLKPGRLTDEERAEMQSHTTLGFEMLNHSDRELLKTAALVAFQHHEKWDGTGYPKGLKGEEIHIFGRILAIADVFDALICKRCYKEPWPVEKIIDMFIDSSGKDFEPKAIEAFLKVKDEMIDVSIRLDDTIS